MKKPKTKAVAERALVRMLKEIVLVEEMMRVTKGPETAPMLGIYISGIGNGVRILRDEIRRGKGGGRGK